MDLENRMMMSYFHWSKEVIIITCVGIVVVVGCMIPLIIAKTPSLLLKWGIIVAVITPIIYCATWTPRYIAIEGDNLVFKKMIGNITIPINTICNIYDIDSSDLSGSIRIFGSGGAFGYLGRFKNNILGNYSMYITEKENLIAVKTHDKTYVFNCENLDLLISLKKIGSHQLYK